MAIATFLSLRRYRKNEERKENRELVERVIEPTIEDLSTLEAKLPRLEPPTMQRWETAKKENPWFTSGREKSLFDKVNKLSGDVSRLATGSSWRQQLMYTLAVRIMEKAVSPPAKPNDARFVTNIYYWWEFANGKQDNRSAEELIFRDTTAKDACTTTGCHFCTEAHPPTAETSVLSEEKSSVEFVKCWLSSSPCKIPRFFRQGPDHPE